MKFIINKKELSQTLQKLFNPTITKQNSIIANNILISSMDNKLKFITTDLDTTTISFQEAEITEAGKFTVPTKRFISIIKELPPSDIVMETVKDNLLIRCEKIEFRINTMNPEEFTQIKEEKKVSLIKIDPQNLEEMIRLTSFCVGHEDVDYVLGGILFEIFEDKINLVATDGRRLSFATRQLPLTQSKIETKLSFILSIKTINELHRLIENREEEIFLFTGENKVGFDFKDTQFITRPIQGEFPNYSQYILPLSQNKLTINRKNFISGLRRADLLSTLNNRGVRLELRKDNIVISKSTPQLGEAKEIINAQYTGAPLEISFNPNYLIDALKNLEEEEIVFEFFGPDKPAILRREDYLYLVVPMKIG